MKKVILISAIAGFTIVSNMGCHRQLPNSFYNVFGSEQERAIIRNTKAEIKARYKIGIEDKHPIKPLRTFSGIKPKIKIKLF